MILLSSCLLFLASTPIMTLLSFLLVLIICILTFSFLLRLFLFLFFVLLLLFLFSSFSFLYFLSHLYMYLLLFLCPLFILFPIQLHRTPALLSPTCLINKKVEYLHSVGFTSEQISKLLVFDLLWSNNLLSWNVCYIYALSMVEGTCLLCVCVSMMKQ